MHLRVLADVECCQMKTEGSHLAQQWIKKKLCQILAMVFG